MTAIASIYTPEGFVIGADGRRLNPDKTLGDDDSEKIFFLTARNVHAVGAWCGAVKFADKKSQLQLKAQTLEIAASISNREFTTLIEYTKNIAGFLHDRFLRWLNQSDAIIDPNIVELAHMRLLGYVARSPEVTSIHLSAEDGVVKLPGIGHEIDPLSRQLNVFSGKQSVHDSMCTSGEIDLCSSLADGEKLIRTYIERCAYVPVEAGNDIGGHIHIAAVTPEGACWLIPPKWRVIESLLADLSS
jgi:hypothetical protein